MTAPLTPDLSPTERAGAEMLAADLRRIFGTRLQSVIAYGVADRTPDEDPLHTLALVTQLTFDDLAACAPQASRWQRIGLAVPLVLTSHEFFRSLDVFPVEYGEIIARHVLVWGADPLDDARVADADLRRACELQAKSHLIHLREGFLERGTEAREVARLIAASAPSFRVVLAHIARLGQDGEPPVPADDALADIIERTVGVSAGLVRDVLQSRVNPSAIADPTALLSRYIAASERVWEYVDSWRRK